MEDKSQSQNTEPYTILNGSFVSVRSASHTNGNVHNGHISNGSAKNGHIKNGSAKLNGSKTSLMSSYDSNPKPTLQEVKGSQLQQLQQNGFQSKVHSSSDDMDQHNATKELQRARREKPPFFYCRWVANRPGLLFGILFIILFLCFVYFNCINISDYFEF